MIPPSLKEQYLRLKESISSKNIEDKLSCKYVNFLNTSKFSCEEKCWLYDKSKGDCCYFINGDKISGWTIRLKYLVKKFPSLLFEQD